MRSSTDVRPGYGPVTHGSADSISLEQEERALAALQAAQLIVRSGARYGEVRPFTVDTRGGRHALYAIKQHWTHVAAERAIDPRRGDVFAYNVLSASRRDLDRIAELLHATFREIRSIVASSEPAECVALLNLQLVGAACEAAVVVHALLEILGDVAPATWLIGSSLGSVAANDEALADHCRGVHAGVVRVRLWLRCV